MHSFLNSKLLNVTPSSSFFHSKAISFSFSPPSYLPLDWHFISPAVHSEWKLNVSSFNTNKYIMSFFIQGEVTPTVAIDSCWLLCVSWAHDTADQRSLVEIGLVTPWPRNLSKRFCLEGQCDSHLDWLVCRRKANPHPLQQQCIWRAVMWKLPILLIQSEMISRAPCFWAAEAREVQTEPIYKQSQWVMIILVLLYQSNTV